MKITVLNGSPKGKYSITLQTVYYLQKKFPEHVFEVFHVGQQIRRYENDLTPILNAIQEAELLLFAYPVYTFLAPSQLHRLMELLKESGANLSGKYVTQITTSKHFYDVTAHRYIQDNCQDMGMKFIKGLSADMEDLTKEKGQREAVAFFRYVLWCTKRDSFEPLPAKRPELQPVEAHVPAAQKEKEEGRKPVVIVTDCRQEDRQLQNMIKRFQAVLPLASRVVNIREYPLRGGCLGCLNCAISEKCVYTDGFDEFLRTEIQTGSAIVYAFTVSDHSMGAAFKKYDDRQFCNGHRTVTMGMPIGYLVSGNYTAETNLQMVIEGRAEAGGNFLAGVAGDERDTDASIDRMAGTLVYAIKHRYTQPQNFYGVGGMKIFRDLIYQMRGMMRADHKFYKQHGQYDFPQKRKGTIVGMYLVGALFSNPKIKAKMGNRMYEGMLAPYRKVVDGANAVK